MRERSIIGVAEVPAVPEGRAFPFPLAAGGSLPRSGVIAAPSRLRRVGLFIEMTVLFVGAPLLVMTAIHVLRLPLFVVLPPLLAAFVLALALDPTFRLRTELARGFSFGTLLGILTLFAAVAAIASGYIASELPVHFLSLPRARPRVWLTIMVLYPLASVIAQELVYRTFFFHRYGPLFGGWRWLAVMVNGMLFALAHVMFNNPVALIGTGLGGVLFAWRYQATRSLWAVVLEHTLYGWLIFTVGLGGYFFTGVANPIVR